MSRINYSIKNIKYAVFGQVFALIISFFSRMVFVNTLGSEYLGLNGLFTNILSMLSLAELGVGTAMVYSMYKPLAENDDIKLNSLMHLYRKTYILIGTIIAIIGLLITPFLSYLVKDMPDIHEINMIYVLYIVNTSLSYFYSYKRSLVIADQKRFVATFYRYLFYFIVNLLQIFILITTRNYLLFVVIQLIGTVIENVLVSRKVDKLYPFLNMRNVQKLDEQEKGIIKKNIKALMFHKIGSVVVLGTDNLLISKYIGIVSVGLYSNYLLITNSLNMIFGLIFQSITASIGNLGVTESQTKQKLTFDKIDFFCFWIYGFTSIAIFVLVNPFIELWLGKEYLFDKELVLLIVTSFYLTGMRKSVLTFKDALGLYWADRYKPIFEAVINLVFSVLLAKKIGISGIFIGTIISTLTTCFWIEPYVLFKNGFKETAKFYFVKYTYNTIIMVITGLVTWKLSEIITGITIISFIAKALLVVIVPNLIFILLFRRKEEFEYFVGIIRGIINGINS